MKQPTQEEIKYNEVLLKPKLQKSLDNLLNKYDLIMTEHHINNIDSLSEFVAKCCYEGNDVLIQKEYCGYLVMVWRS